MDQTQDRRKVAALRLWNATQLRQHLQNAIQMGKPRAKSVNEFIQHEFTLKQRVRIALDLVRQALEELGLDVAQNLRRFSASFGELRVGLLPLTQLSGTLPLGRVHGLDHFLEQLILSFLAINNLLKQFQHDDVLTISAINYILAVGRNIDTED